MLYQKLEFFLGYYHVQNIPQIHTLNFNHKYLTTTHSYVTTIMLPCCCRAALPLPPLPLCCSCHHHAATLLPPHCRHCYTAAAAVLPASAAVLPPSCHHRHCHHAAATAAAAAKLPSLPLSTLWDMFWWWKRIVYDDRHWFFSTFLVISTWHWILAWGDAFSIQCLNLTVIKFYSSLIVSIEPSGKINGKRSKLLLWFQFNKSNQFIITSIGKWVKEQPADWYGIIN